SASLVPDLALAQSIQTSSQPGQEAVAQGVDLDQVFIRIKQEVGYFESTNPKTPKDWDALLKRLKLIDAVTGKPLKSLYGDGHILFHIKKVKMDFTADRVDTGSVEAALKVPFGPSESNIDAGGNVKNKKLSTQEIVYSYYPVTRDTSSAGQDDAADFDFLVHDHTAV